MSVEFGITEWQDVYFGIAAGGLLGVTLETSLCERGAGYPAQYLVNLALCCQGCFSGPSCPDPECTIPGVRNELELWLSVSCYPYGWGRMLVFKKKLKSH